MATTTTFGKPDITAMRAELQVRFIGASTNATMTVAGAI
jgi:hypothetical protein